MSKVFIVGGGAQYRAMFAKHGWECVSNIWEADLVQFTGGADVTPALYGEKNTHSGNSPARDIEEAGYFAIAKRMHKPMAGICRGGQFLNVMNGGHMVQHIEGHAIHGTHEVSDMTNYPPRKIQVTSTHHQLMIPNLDVGIVLAYANILKDRDYDAEVVYYEDNECLCFQPHPEFNGYDECTEYYFYLLKECLGF